MVKNMYSYIKKFCDEKLTAKTKNVRTFVFVGVIASLISFMLLSYWSLNNMATDNTKIVETMLTARIYDTIRGKLNEPVYVARTMAADDYLKNTLKSETDIGEAEYDNIMKNYLAGIKGNFHYDTAFLVSAKSLRYNTHDKIKVINPQGVRADRWYSFFVEKKHSYDLSIDVDSLLPDQWTLFVNARIEDDNGSLLGVCGVGVNITDLQETFKSIEEEYDVKIRLVDKTGAVRLNSESSNIFEAYLGKDNVIREENDDYVYNKLSTGGFIVTKYLDDLNWYLVVTNDNTILNHEFSRVVALFGWLSLIIALVVIVFMIVVLRNFDSKEEERLRAAAANKAKGAFLSQMSHEIRTPINVIIGMNEMILRESTENAIQEYANNARSAGTSLLTLVNDILDFSKIEAGKMEIIPAEYDISTVINDLFNMTNPLAEAKNLKLEFIANENIPSRLYGDDVRLKQVITNLLTNAVKYTERGSVTFEIDAEKKDNKHCLLHVFVKDTGKGIKKEDLPKLFSKFDRIEEKENRYVEGTGLGLAITKRLLNMMNSEIVAESIYKLGSCFSFTLKQEVRSWDPIGNFHAALKDNLKHHEEYKERFIAPDAEVLVVDDNKMNVVVFKNLLKKTKVKIDEAYGGSEAVLLTAKKKYDLMFIDHMMPDIDGIETLHEIKSSKNNPNRETFAICLTANAISGAKEKYMEAGFDDYLTKPINPQKLEIMLQERLPKEKILDDDASKEDNAKGSTLMAFLESVKGIDAKAGLQNNGGEELYAEVLKIYADTANSYAEEIESFLSNGDLKKATIKIHALKSTSRIIGGTLIGEDAQRLENAGKAGDYETLSKEIPALLEECRGLGKKLQSYFISLESKDKAPNKDLPPIDDLTLKDAYEKIKQAAQKCDSFSIEETLKELKKYSFSEVEQKRIEKICDELDNFNFDGICEVI